MKRYFVRLDDGCIRGPWTLPAIYDCISEGSLPEQLSILDATNLAIEEIDPQSEWLPLPPLTPPVKLLSTARRWVLVIAPLALAGAVLFPPMVTVKLASFQVPVWPAATLASLLLAWCLFPPQDGA